MATLDRIILIVGLAFILLSASFCVENIRKVSANHNIYLPLVPNTALIQNTIADGEQTWCVNSAAANYPRFVSDLRRVNDAYAAKWGVAHRQIVGTFESVQAAASAGCEVWHQGRYDQFCSGCAANISYANWPVTVRYNLGLGYFSFDTAHGHELGHGLLGLHEQYNDSGGIFCTRRTDTVMDCGSRVWEPQPLDIERACDKIDPDGTHFAGCTEAPPPPQWPWGPCADWGGCYRQDLDAWIAQDGWVWTSATGWLAHVPVTSWGGAWFPQVGAWIDQHGAVFPTWGPLAFSWQPLPPWLN